jgi:cell division protease FtsH
MQEEGDSAKVSSGQDETGDSAEVSPGQDETPESPSGQSVPPETPSETPPERSQIPEDQNKERGGESPEKKPKGIRGIIAPLLILAFFLIFVVVVGQQTIGGKTKDLSLNDFYSLLAKGKIEKIQILKTETKIFLREAEGGSKKKVLKVPESYFRDRADLLRKPTSEAASAPGLTDEQKRFLAKLENPSPPEIRFDPGESVLLSMLYTFGPLLLILLLLWFVLFRQVRGPMGTGSILSFGRSKAKLSDKTKNLVTFDDVAGIEEAKEEVQQIIEFLKDSGKFKRIGARIPRGVLLVGQPGTGKTLLAKAIAGEAGVPFFSISGSDFVEMFVGVGASRVRDLFKQAKDNAPCIIFLDEIDAVGRRRGSGLGGGHDEREQTLNAILVEMDGFERNVGIIMVAATNRPDVLDPALLRPGRFDREIVLDLPDLKGREAILLVHSRDVKIEDNIDFSVIARMTPMFSGAELEALINEAALIAVMQGKEKVDMACLEEARDKVRWGSEKRSRVMSEEDRKIAAFHESGHALLAHLLPDMDPLHKVTIIPRGTFLGATMQVPEKDRYTMRRKYLLGQIKTLLGGFIAEQIFFDDVTSGSQNDIKNATQLVRLMVCEWGMSDNVGPINYSISHDTVFLGREFSGPKNFSEATAQKIDKEIKLIITRQYEETRTFMLEHKEHIQKLAEALLKYETLSGEDVDKLVNGASVEDLQKNSKPANDTVQPPETAGKGEAKE